MADGCAICREHDCEEKRAAFKREPFLGPCFELGAQWHSYDDGATWLRFPTVEQVREGMERRGHIARMTVTSIDMETGSVTVKANG